MAFPRSVTRLALESTWRARVQMAQRRYHDAAAKYQQAVEERVQRMAPTADGALAVTQAARAEATARLEYMRLLQIFSELVVHGKLPEE